MPNSLEDKSKSIAGIQYLRGVASLMVVFFHARSYFGVVPDWTRIGSRGVDIFFVISGFIMVYATRNIGNDVSAIRSCATFLGKRFIRVVPLYWLALLITVYPYFVNWFETGAITSDLVSIFKDFAFVPHLSIDEDERGEIFPALIQGWTLNYEIAFYLLFGIAMLAKQYRIIVISSVLAGLVLLGKLNHFHDISALFYTNTILLEFVYGIILYEIYAITHHLSFNRLTLLSLAIVGCSLLFVGSATNDKVVLGAASAIIVWVFIQIFRDGHNLPLKLLGDASYSIYLFHLASFKLARALVSYFSINSTGYINIVTIIAVHVLISIVTGIAVYYFIERPLLRLLRNGFERLSKFGMACYSQLNAAVASKS